MDISVVIPLLNEEESLPELSAWIAKVMNENNYTYEVLFIDDGSTDGTPKIATETQVNENVQLSVLTDGEHYGKGHAVRKGILQSNGNIVMFMDSGKTVALDFISQGLDKIQNGESQIVLGSRHLPESLILKPLVWYRRLVSHFFKIFIKLIFPSIRGFSDTQCGFKMYDGSVARKLYSDSLIHGFLFDIEILKRAKKNQFAIHEMPIEWICDRDSRLSFFPTIWEVLRDIWKLKFSS